MVVTIQLAGPLAESSTTPVKAGELLLASSITFGAAGLRPDTGKEAWQNPELTCYFSTPVTVGKDAVYLVTGTKPPAFFQVEATLRCVDTATGKEHWKKPRVGKYHASLLRTGDDKLLMLDDAGNLRLLDPSTQGYRELCRAKICGETWAHPALADGRVYIRDGRELLGLSLRE